MRRLPVSIATAIVGLMTVAFAATVSAAPKDISGIYVNEQITLILRGDSTGNYTGTIAVGGKSHPLAGVYTEASGLLGGFKVDNQSFDISIDVQDDGTLLLQSEKKRHILKRKEVAAPVEQPVPQPQPAPANQPGQITPNGQPAAGGPALPAFMKTGYRMYWSTGRSTTNGASLVPDPNGFIERNGKRYSLRGHNGRGQESMQTVTVQEATEKGILAEMRLFSIDANLQGKVISTGGISLVAGNPVALGDYWMNPAVLAQIPQGREVDGTTTVRVRYAALGKEFNAIALFRTNGDGSASLTYDLDSGLLLAGYRCDRAPDFAVQSPDGTHHFNGSVTIERFNLLGARSIDFAGANQDAPAWAVKGFTMEFRGGYRLEMQQQGPYALPPQQGFPVAMSFAFQGGTKKTAVAQFSMVKNIDRGGLNDGGQGMRCFGGAMYFGALWMSPGVIQKLQPNAVLDEDRITGYRTIFAGVRGGVAVIVEKGPNESTECYFDVQSGMLVGWKNGLQMIPGATQVTEMQLVRRQ
ncbi:hypothetical protein [Humisphaera borealis]|uniref:Uncharacterized protein n=1 Tax=Humisphaera borealis TaxID=2807512 RepID=A0A7M2WZD3_9BACT|nr:hypothetical protein [Humisphaera borealis]QOV90753.1 hypothetical protein IPV69_05175 [Humisphaera borealis]